MILLLSAMLFGPAIVLSIILYVPRLKFPRRRYVLSYGEPGWKKRWVRR